MEEEAEEEEEEKEAEEEEEEESSSISVWWPLSLSLSLSLQTKKWRKKQRRFFLSFFREFSLKGFLPLFFPWKMLGNIFLNLICVCPQLFNGLFYIQCVCVSYCKYIY